MKNYVENSKGQKIKTPMKVRMLINKGTYTVKLESSAMTLEKYTRTFDNFWDAKSYEKELQERQKNRKIAYILKMQNKEKNATSTTKPKKKGNFTPKKYKKGQKLEKPPKKLGRTVVINKKVGK